MPISFQTIWSKPSSVLFGQMYEDVAIEEGVFTARSRVFTIASAGCSAIALSRVHDVTAVDINAEQLEYARQRAAGAPARVGRAEHAMGLGRRAMVVAGWRNSLLSEFVHMRECDEQLAFWRD